MQLLVAGSDRVDAGKTTFATGLCSYLEVPGFKPRAGNDFWFDHDDVLATLAAGRLVGKDARRLSEAAPDTLTPEQLNPVHRLWTPLGSSRRGLLGQSGRAFLLDRIGAPPSQQWVLNGTVEHPELVTARLPTDGARVVETVEALNELTREIHVPALEQLHERVRSTADAVVESYADIALPMVGYEPDAVVVVGPRRARIYDGGRYTTACEVAAGSAREGQLEETTGSVLEMIEPVESASLPALARDTRGDPSAVATALEPTYERLLAAVGS